MPPIERMTVESIGAGYDRGDFWATDVVSACVERIALLEPFLSVAPRGYAAHGWSAST